MRLTLAVHKAFTAPKTAREDISFVIRPNAEDKTTYVSLLIKQEVAAVCEVAAMYKSFSTNTIISDMTKILSAVAQGNTFSNICISTSNTRFRPLFPYLGRSGEMSTLSQIIRLTRLELNKKKSSTQYLISLSCAGIAPRGNIIDMLFPNNTSFSLSRDETGLVHYENLTEVACTTDEEIAAILLAIQGEYNRIAEDPAYNVTSPEVKHRGREKDKEREKEKEKEKKVPSLRINITVRKFELVEQPSESVSDSADADSNAVTGKSTSLDALSASGGLQLYPPGAPIKPREQPAEGYYWSDISTGEMIFYYVTIHDVLGIIGKTSRLSTYILPEISKSNASAFFEIDSDADAKTCLMTFDIMNELIHRGSHAWRAAGVDIFRLSEVHLHHSTTSDLNGSRPRSRVSRSYFTAEEVEGSGTDHQISMRRTKTQVEDEKKRKEYRDQQRRTISRLMDSPAEAKRSVPNGEDSEDSVDAFKITTAQNQNIVGAKKRTSRPPSRTSKTSRPQTASTVTAAAVLSTPGSNRTSVAKHKDVKESKDAKGSKRDAGKESRDIKEGTRSDIKSDPKQHTSINLLDTQFSKIAKVLSLTERSMREEKENTKGTVSPRRSGNKSPIGKAITDRSSLHASVSLPNVSSPVIPTSPPSVGGTVTVKRLSIENDRDRSKRAPSWQSSSPTVVRPREQSAGAAKIERAHTAAKASSNRDARSRNSHDRPMSSTLDKTELFNLSRGSSVCSKPNSRSGSQPQSCAQHSPKQSKAQSRKQDSPTRKHSGHRRSEPAPTPSPKQHTFESEVLAQYRSMHIPSDKNGQFDFISKLQLEIKRLARELEETRISKVIIESGKNDLIAEVSKLKEEVASLTEQQKYKSYTIKRLEKQLMEAKEKTVRTSFVSRHGVDSSVAGTSSGGKRQRSYNDLLIELESLKLVNSELQAELTVQQENLRLNDGRSPNAADPQQDPHAKINELQQLLRNALIENKDLRLEVTSLQEMLDVQRFQALCPSLLAGQKSEDRQSLEAKLNEATKINEQYEVQIAELENAITAADERLTLYESRQNRETLLVETIAQLRGQIHHMTKRLLDYEQQEGSMSLPLN